MDLEAKFTGIRFPEGTQMKKVFSMSRTKLALGALVVALVVAPLAALASNSFADVPDSHTFHSHIEWMKDNGITSGCGDGTNYCPDNNRAGLNPTPCILIFIFINCLRYFSAL